MFIITVTLNLAFIRYNNNIFQHVCFYLIKGLVKTGQSCYLSFLFCFKFQTNTAIIQKKLKIDQASAYVCLQLTFKSTTASMILLNDGRNSLETTRKAVQCMYLWLCTFT
jgi:hypothetical protein